MTDDNNLEIIPEEAVIVRRIFDMYLSGAGCTAIAKTLNAEGIRNARGNRWSANGILDLISNEKYMGDVLMGKNVYIERRKLNNMNGPIRQALLFGRYTRGDRKQGNLPSSTASAQGA